jgi:hypothetical protein
VRRGLTVKARWIHLSIPPFRWLWSYFLLFTTAQVTSFSPTWNLCLLELEVPVNNLDESNSLRYLKDFCLVMHWPGEDWHAVCPPIMEVIVTLQSARNLKAQMGLDVAWCVPKSPVPLKFPLSELCNSQSIPYPYPPDSLILRGPIQLLMGNPQLRYPQSNLYNGRKQS